MSDLEDDREWWSALVGDNDRALQQEPEGERWQSIVGGAFNPYSTSNADLAPDPGEELQADDLTTSNGWLAQDVPANSIDPVHDNQFSQSSDHVSFDYDDPDHNNDADDHGDAG